MYEELVKALRDDNACLSIKTAHEAADAIEELQRQIDGWIEQERKALLKSVLKWIKIESRPMDEEERQYYSDHSGYNLTDDEAVIYCCQLPEHGQEVLVCNRYGHVWIDTFDDDPDYGVGFETNGDMDGLVAWMPLPEPPKEET